MDIKSPEERSRNMAAIHSKNTKPEVWFRKQLFAKGYRYSLNTNKVPGHPDIYLRKYNTAIFVHGCFWHRHPGCKYAYMPKSRVEFWQKKFEANIKRDHVVRMELQNKEIKCLIAEDETNSRTILKQCFSEERTDVTKIRDHLSWGEKNAFALILFMYYAVMQNPDLIILDDPISSFDTNKKYAILHRMFKNIGKRDISLEGKTVLLLTHDFEPITDFIVVGKLGEEKAQASFICNEHGIVKSHKIDANSDVKLITMECGEIAKNTDINIVSRVAFLRKLSELNGRSGDWGLVYEILSCLIHANEIKRKIGNNTYIDIAPEDVALGISKIKEYISDFDYNELKNNIYTKEGIKSLYAIETNAYLKVQLFREMNEILSNNEVKITQMDSAWYKFIDETYHIENDYLHFLDIIKFNIVPSYIIDNVDKIVSGL